MQVDFSVKVRPKQALNLMINKKIYTSIIEASGALGVPRATLTREYKRFLKSNRKKMEVTVNKVVEVDLIFEKIEGE
jgi:hypothetical protein